MMLYLYYVVCRLYGNLYSLLVRSICGAKLLIFSEISKIVE